MYLDECRSGPKSNDDGLVKGGGGGGVIVFNVTFNNNPIISCGGQFYLGTYIFKNLDGQKLLIGINKQMHK